MRLATLMLATALAGCTPTHRVTVLAPPAAYLEPCALPALPETNPELSAALAQAYHCAELGNADKKRIAEWVKRQSE